MSETAEEVERVQVAAEYAIGYESMRAVVRAEVERTNLTSTARRLGVTWRTLVNFLAGGEPSRRLWDAGAELARDRPKPRVYPAAVALNLLADAYPRGGRAELRQGMAGALVAACEARGVPVPAGLREAADGR